MKCIWSLAAVSFAVASSAFASCEKSTADIAVQPPAKHCRSHFTGGLMTDKYKSGTSSKIFVEDEMSEYVGAGSYPDNEAAFPKAIATSFDGVAIDKGTRITIYRGKHFSGDILLQAQGPAIINNVEWQNHSDYRTAVLSEWDDPYRTDFPKSVRIWSPSGMHEWRGGSMRIECEAQFGDTYAPALAITPAGDRLRATATDSEDSNANKVLDKGEDLNGNGAVDRRSEDLNGNESLEPDEDIDRDGILNRDSGIASIALCSDAHNIELKVQPFTKGDLTVDFEVRTIDPLESGHGTILVSDLAGNTAEHPVAEFGGGFVRFGDDFGHVDLGEIGGNTDLPGSLDLTGAVVAGKPIVTITTDFSVDGATLEIDPGAGWVKLDGQSLALSDSDRNAWPIRIRSGRCIGGGADGFTINVAGFDRNRQPASKSLAYSLHLRRTPWLVCWWPVLAGAAAALALAAIVYGFVSPLRFPRSLGVILSPEEDIAEGVFHSIRSGHGTGSGFYRNARAYIRTDFRICGNPSGAVACLRASAGKPTIQPASGCEVLRQTADGAWEELPAREVPVNYGAVYRDAGAGLFFRIGLG